MRAAIRNWPPLKKRCLRFIELNCRRLLWTLLLIVALPLIVGVGYCMLQPASETAFAISATTDQMLVEPLCEDRLVWDLPAGHVLPVSAPPEAMACAGPAAPVTVELRGGAQALLTSRSDRRLDARLSPGILTDACRLPQGRSAISVQVGGVDLPADALGYLYRSGDCPQTGTDDAVDAPDAKDAVRARGVLIVSGRLQIGAAIPEGAGWGSGAAMVSLLHEGEIVARHLAPFTNERMTLLEEKIDAGSIINTIPCLSETAATNNDALKECLDAAISTPGFIRLMEGGLDVQAYPTRIVGVSPHMGEQRLVNLTRWDILIASPVAQLLAAVFAVLWWLGDVSEKLQGLNKLPRLGFFKKGKTK